MKVFINAILELFILLIAVVIVLVGAKILKIENPYTDYEKTHPNNVVTVGMACQLIPEGTEITHEKTAEMLNYILFRKDKWDVPEWFTAFLNRKVSISAAKVYCLYFPVGFVAAFLCLLLGIGFPFSILKKHSISRLFHEALVNENRVYVDFYGTILGHPGETRAALLTIITWIAHGGGR